MADATDDEPVLTCGDLLIDLAGHQAFVAGTAIDLSHLQFVVLTTLVRAAPRAVSYADLVERAWPRRAASANDVRSTVSRLRRALGHGPSRPSVDLVRSHGYRLVPPPGSQRVSPPAGGDHG